ncbi:MULTISPECIES: hypothetical protein [Thermococcus]|uniref:Uncharacterized protein n=2 Tax=Thermococcus sibiricus TaxID=172049 RepID=C6A3D4_THESM|nr:MULTISPECIES: hypothetical protein [Thermococcus]KUK29067.1 MAG: Uncharacterized protein XD61_0391 [Thermococcus sp. 40_45]HII68160.1 hypothetical protein [Thermococcaceae archaeon]ACS90129.1 hypothetical protein TSIB_1075 [Thermococcus sibiricus MM 739]KUK18686.1 MAG: Uncharacterized protein XD54_0071 [Thermococcus sibiricus]MBC7094969.1 hypothetical protein [Thermococcus sp.]
MSNLKCFDYIIIEDPKISSKRISSIYRLSLDNEEKVFKLIHTYKERIPKKESKTFAKLMSIVPAINYGLFTPLIYFDFPIDKRDLKFFKDMMEITAKDIFVNRIIKRTGFVREEFIPKEVKPDLARPIAKVKAKEVIKEDVKFNADYNKCAVMLSGGKESLLTYGLLKEIGCDVYPFFFNESGGHWKVALTAYKWFEKNESNTKKVWSNVDRLYNFIESNMKILQDVNKPKAEVYPIRLFFFEHYIFSFLPLIYKYNIGNVLLGNEYDDPRNLSYEQQGIPHFYAVFDQSQYFDKYMSQWFAKRSLKIRQWSAVRPLSGLIVERILHNRYPDLFMLQRSCHSVHKEGNEYVPCGTCFKCNGIQTFLLANGIDPKLIKYKEEHIKGLAKRIRDGKIRLDEDELLHSLYLIKMHNPEFELSGEEREHVEMLHFDDRNSHFDNIPVEFREKLYSIFEGYTKGYLYLKDNEWKRITREEALNGVLRNRR